MVANDSFPVAEPNSMLLVPARTVNADVNLPYPSADLAVPFDRGAVPCVACQLDLRDPAIR
jgi:hypothetical protein